MTLLVASALAAGLERSPRPGWVELHADQEQAVQPEGEARASLQFLLVDDQLRMPSEGVQEAWYLHRSLRVVTPEGLDSGARFEVDYDPSHQTVLFHDVSVYRDGAWQDRLAVASATEIRRESDLHIGMMDGLHTLTVLLPDVQVGDVVRYSYTMSGDDPVFEGHWDSSVDMAWGLPAERRVLAVVGEHVPEPGSHGAVPEPTRSSRRLVWDYGPVEAVDLEPGAPPGASEQPWVELSTWQSWGEVVDWALPLYETQTQDPELQALADRLAAEPDPVTAAVTWVQDEVRYFGIELAEGSHVPRAPSTVLELRYGDCKDKTLLLASILAHMGIQSWPALVNSQAMPLDRWLPRPSAFDHVILYVDQGQGVWVDPTDRLQGGSGVDRYVPDYGQALLVKPGTEELVEMFPRGRPTRLLRTTWSYVLDGKGARLEIDEEAEGREADELRAWFSDSILGDIAEALADDYGQGLFLTPRGQPTLEDDRAASKATLRSAFTVQDPWTLELDGSQTFTLMDPTVFEALPYPEPDRRAPLALPEGLALVDELRVQAPPSVSFDEAQGHLDNPWFRFTLSSAQSPGQLEETYTLRVLSSRVEARDLRAYRAQLDELYGYSGVAARRETASASQGGSWLGAYALGLVSGVGLSAGLASLFAALVLLLKTRTISSS